MILQPPHQNSDRSSTRVKLTKKTDPKKLRANSGQKPPGPSFTFIPNFLTSNMEIRDPIVVYNKKKLSVDEYLQFERESLEKHEFYRNEVFAMAGAGPRHNVIFSNIFGKLAYELKGKPCRPFGSDMRIHIPENTFFTYPDISIYCGDIIPAETDHETVVHPTVVMEILSPSTKDYDRGGKFKLYRDIATLKNLFSSTRKQSA